MMEQVLESNGWSCYKIIMAINSINYVMLNHHTTRNRFLNFR